MSLDLTMGVVFGGIILVCIGIIIIGAIGDFLNGDCWPGRKQ